MAIINQLLELLQGLKTDATNLHRDLDEDDEREETKGDLSQLFNKFDELKSLMSKLNESDIAKLQGELKKLMSGEENILEYNRDVNDILLAVKKRTEQHEPTKDKVIEHLPPEQKHENVGSVFNNWGSLLREVQNFIEQATSNKVGSR
jgi:hypothetical protein